MPRTRVALALAALTVAALAVPTGGASVAADAAGPAPAARQAAAERGSPGQWTKMSTGSGGITYSSSLFRTSDKVLHVVYPNGNSTSGGQIGHTAVSAGGSTIRRNNVLAAPWSIVENTPAVVAGPSGGLRVAFGGQQSTSPGFWSDGRMYTLTAPASGAGWTLPSEAVGNSHTAFASYGTAATTLADGTPIAAFPINSSITWHVGTGADPDQSFSVAACCAYDLAMVRSGPEVYLAWYANGGTSATQGTFVRRIHPTLGPILKAPGSSVGGDSAPTERVAMAARAGGGVYLAYCSGYPTCNGVKLWKVGSSSSSVVSVPNSRYAARIALAAAPGGRLWLSWGDNVPSVRALRTNAAVSRLGAIRTLGVPRGHRAIYDLSMEGSTGRGDVVINVGDGFWHTQALAGLSLSASASTWRHGRAKTVRFTVTDAGSRVSGARVAVGSLRCTTASTGQCTITFPASTRAGYRTATATKTSYGSGSKRLRVT